MATVEYLSTANGKPHILLETGQVLELWDADMGHLADGQAVFGVEVDSYSGNLEHLTITDTQSLKTWLFRFEPQWGTVEYAGSK